METLRTDKANHLTISELVKNTVNHLAYELPQLIIKPSFYKRIFSAIDPDDKKLRASIEAFIEITSSIGEDKTEKILTKQVRNEWFFLSLFLAISESKTSDILIKYIIKWYLKSLIEQKLKYFQIFERNLSLRSSYEIMNIISFGLVVTRTSTKIAI